MSVPVLSVIVPTCDRPVPLEACLKTLVTQDCPELEILVSDNACGLETAAVLDAIDDERLRVVRLENRLGMADHFEFAMGQARGEWIAFLGDDDALLPGAAARFVDLAESSGVDAICSARCDYVWPDAGDGSHGVLRVPLKTGFEKRDSREWIEKVLKGKASYGVLPWVYMGGFARRSVMEGIKEQLGLYFTSPNPDAQSAVAVASMMDQYGYSFTPLVVGGTCGQSNGKKWIEGKKIDTKEHEFFRNTTRQFHPMLGDGNVYSMSLIFYDAFLKTEKLRSYEIETSLEEQIGIALAGVKPKTRDIIENYCREVAERNEIDFEVIAKDALSEARRRRFSKKLNKLLPWLGRRQRREVKQIKSDELDDVFEAARKAGELLDGVAGS